jgi:large-conductance mechanosensitive channel
MFESLDRPLRGTYHDMQVFYASKDVVSFAVSVTMGFATREVILVFVHDVIVPLLKLIARGVGLRQVYRVVSKAAHGAHMSNVLNVVNRVTYAVFIWFVLLVFSFMLLEYFVGKILLRVQPGENKHAEWSE